MELFDKRFVHFVWDDELVGKTGIMSNDIKCLRDYVNRPCDLELIEHSSDESQPFQTTDGIRFRFAYYDPNYEAKKAYNEGKEIQYRVKGFVDWEDYTNQNPCRDDEDREWCVKPDEEKKYRSYESSAEMIADFIDRFNVKCPSYCEPLIWVKGKVVDIRYLVFAFCEDAVKFNDDEPFGLDLLFDEYTYLDGSPVGMEVKE